MASPRPQLALITTSSRLPVTGLTVNRTPETSEEIMACTTTAIDTLWWSRPWLAIYATTRSAHNEAQQCLMCSSSAGTPRMFK